MGSLPIFNYSPLEVVAIESVAGQFRVASRQHHLPLVFKFIMSLPVTNLTVQMLFAVQRTRMISLRLALTSKLIGNQSLAVIKVAKKQLKQ